MAARNRLFGFDPDPLVDNRAHRSCDLDHAHHLHLRQGYLVACLELM